MSKRILFLALALLLCLSLCACGGQAEPASAPAPTADPVPAQTPAPEPAESPTPRPEDPNARPALPDAGLHEAEETPAEDPEISARRELAKEYLEKDVEDLIERLGEPLSRSYAPSCVGKGDDGELEYEGFTVYTYREGGRETVVDVS